MLLLLLILAATPAPESYAVDGQSWHNLRSSRPVTTRPAASQPASAPAPRVYSYRSTSQPAPPPLRTWPGDHLNARRPGSNLARLLNGRKPQIVIGPRGNIVHEPDDTPPPTGPAPTKRRR